MNLYRFHGFCLDFHSVVGDCYKVITTVDNGYYAEISCQSFRKALRILKSALGDREYVISRTYVVTNKFGKSSARLMK